MKSIDPYFYIKKIYPDILENIKSLVKETYDGKTTPSMVYSCLFEYIQDINTMKKDTIDKKKIIDIIDCTILEGDKNFKNAAIISFLEDLANPSFKDLYNCFSKYFSKNIRKVKSEIDSYWLD